MAQSAQVLRDDIEACLAVGMNDFLGKPFRAEGLEDLLRRVLGVASPGCGTVRSAAAVSAGEAAVDRSVLVGHVEALGLSAATQIVETWRRTTASIDGALGDATARGARGEVAEIAHRLKSSSRHVGLVGLADRAAAVERSARGAASALDDPVRDLLATLVAARGALDVAWSEIATAQPAKT